MKQARIPNDNEFKRLLAVVASTRYCKRNRLIVMLSYYAGLRVSEIAALKISDVLNADKTVKDHIALSAAYTKGNEARIVFMNDKLQKEITQFVVSIHPLDFNAPLISTQKRKAFSANTMCQLFMDLYSKAGIAGASSHSGRRSFITKLAHNGVSAKVIMTLAGHKHLSTTQRYIDVNDEMMRKAVQLL